MAKLNSRQRWKESVVPFRAADGFQCNLIHIRGERPPEKGPVILVHGAGVRANSFRAPLETTIVDFLVDNGYDVWLENWRASIDFAPNHWTLDQAAYYDHPEAVKTVVKETGKEEVKAIVHCQGSSSFMMSAIAGLIPEVKTILSNAVSMHPIVPPKTKLAVLLLVDMLAMFTSYLNPGWGIRAPSIVPKIITLYVRLTHHECNNMVCKMASFTYGTDRPTLWMHENISEKTHEWIKQEFRHVPLSFFKQMKSCLKKGHLVSVEGIDGLPDDFTTLPPQTDARFSFITGELNRCFLAESQIKTFEYFDKHRRNYHSLHILPSYSHFDVFIGNRAERDVFPLILKELG
jgi:hypothetical protein